MAEKSIELLGNRILKLTCDWGLNFNHGLFLSEQGRAFINDFECRGFVNASFQYEMLLENLGSGLVRARIEHLGDRELIWRGKWHAWNGEENLKIVPLIDRRHLSPDSPLRIGDISRFLLLHITNNTPQSKCLRLKCQQQSGPCLYYIKQTLDGSGEKSLFLFLIHASLFFPLSVSSSHYGDQSGAVKFHWKINWIRYFGPFEIANNMLKGAIGDHWKGRYVPYGPWKKTPEMEEGTKVADLGNCLKSLAPFIAKATKGIKANADQIQ